MTETTETQAVPDVAALQAKIAELEAKLAAPPAEPEPPAASPLEEAQRRLARSVGAAGAREIAAILEPLVQQVTAMSAAHAATEQARLTALYPELRNPDAWRLVSGSGNAEATAKTLYGERRPTQRLNVSETSARAVSRESTAKLTPEERFLLAFQEVKAGRTVDEAVASLEN